MAVHNITVSGTVSSDGKSLPGAEVHASIDTGAKGGLIWKDAVTGPEGAYNLAGPEGTWTIYAWNKEKHAAEVSKTFGPGDQADTIDLELKAENKSSVKGVVVWQDGGQSPKDRAAPVPFGLVKAFPRSGPAQGEAPRHAWTGPDGGFSFDPDRPLALGRWEFVVLHENALPRTPRQPVLLDGSELEPLRLEVWRKEGEVDANVGKMVLRGPGHGPRLVSRAVGNHPPGEQDVGDRRPQHDGPVGVDRTGERIAEQPAGAGPDYPERDASGCHERDRERVAGGGRVGQRFHRARQGADWTGGSGHGCGHESRRPGQVCGLPGGPDAACPTKGARFPLDDGPAAAGGDRVLGACRRAREPDCQGRVVQLHVPLLPSRAVSAHRQPGRDARPGRRDRLPAVAGHHYPERRGQRPAARFRQPVHSRAGRFSSGLPTLVDAGLRTRHGRKAARGSDRRQDSQA